MISRDEARMQSAFGQPPLDDPQCENCGRSMISRFGGELVDAECPSCTDDFEREALAGKVTDEEGHTMLFVFPDGRKTREAPSGGSDSN